MGKYKIDVRQIICIILCLAALIGFILPAVSLGIDFFGNSRSINLSLASLFESSESRFGGSELSQADLFNLSGNNMFEDLFSDIRGKLITSVGAYFITLILLIIILVFTILNKFKIANIVMSAASIGLFAYAGNTVLSLTEILISGIENALGFFAMFINITDMIKINLGNGYWVTIIMLGCMLAAKIVFFVYSKYQSRKLSKIVERRNGGKKNI